MLDLSAPNAVCAGFAARLAPQPQDQNLIGKMFSFQSSTRSAFWGEPTGPLFLRSCFAQSLRWSAAISPMASECNQVTRTASAPGSRQLRRYHGQMIAQVRVFFLLWRFPLGQRAQSRKANGSGSLAADQAGRSGLEVNDRASSMSRNTLRSVREFSGTPLPSE